MSLPALRLPLLRSWPSAPDISSGIRRALLGRTLVLPGALGEAEREEIIELLALFAELPARVVPYPDHARGGELSIVALSIDGDPGQGPEDGIVVCERRLGPGERRLGLGHQLILLRDAIAESVGRSHSGTSLQAVGAWIAEVADTPSTALRFASGALVKHLDDPIADEGGIFLGGLAAVIGWLLRGVDSRVAEWVIAHSTGAPHPGRLLSAEALLLGEAAARLRAYEAGLVVLMPEKERDALELRRPLETLRHLDSLPVEVTLADIAQAIVPEIDPAAAQVLRRLLRPRPKPLGLEGPRPVRDFRGRDEVIDRLLRLFEPASEIRTTVLYGVDGAGKRQVAAAVGERLIARLEPVWVSFGEGPEAAWMRVAKALGVETQNAELILRDLNGVPRWMCAVHEALAFRPCLLVVEGAETLPEDEVPRWLPSGPGTSCVLVLSNRAERALERSHDAIAVRLGGLAIEPARLLLAEKAPRFAEAIRAGEADRLIASLGGHPGALSLASALLDHRKSLAEVTEDVRRGDQAIPEVLREVIGGLPEDEGKVLRALSVCAPEGSPPELALAVAMTRRGKETLNRLIDRAMVLPAGRIVKLAGVVRIEVARRLDGEREARWELEGRHAETVAKMVAAARERQDLTTQEDLHADLLVAAERATARSRAGEREIVQTVAHLADELSWYPGKSPGDSARLAVEAFQVALEVDPENPDWQRKLFAAYRMAGDSLRARGDTAGPLEAYRTARAMGERFAQEHANDSEWQRELSVIHHRIGDVLLLQGDKDNAEKAYDDALSVCRRFADDAADTQWQHGLLVSHTKVGDVWRARGDAERALQEFRAASRIAERLVEEEPDKADWQADLSWSQQKIGDVLSFTGDTRGALEAYEAALRIRERLIQQDPANARWQRDLAVTCDRIGDELLSRGDHEQALTEFRRALAIRERLVRQDPVDAYRRRELSLSHSKIGNVALARRDKERGLEACRECLIIRERLSRQDPHNAQWQADLAYACWKVAECHLLPPHTPVEIAAARTLLERARRTLAELAVASRLTKKQQEWLPEVEDALRSLPAAP